MALRPASDFPTPAFRVAVPLLLTALLAIWDGIAIRQKGWLYAVVVAAVGVAAIPLVLRARTARALAVATLALLVVAHFVAFCVWGAFVEWS